MTLKQIREDKRVYEVNQVSDEDFKYEVSLEDGYQFDDGSSVQVYNTVKEIAYDLSHNVEEVEEVEEVVEVITSTTLEKKVFMRPQDYNELAGKLIEYDMELSQREFIASKKKDFKALKKIYEIKANIDKLLEVIEEEY